MSTDSEMIGKKVALQIFAFDSNVSLRKVILKEMDEQGLRPVTIQELRALGDGFYWLRRENYPLAAIEIPFNRKAGYSVAYLHGSVPRERIMGIAWFDSKGADHCCRFLAVPK